jgi:tetratricopeptide (TPR) repeat protein
MHAIRMDGTPNRRLRLRWVSPILILVCLPTALLLGQTESRRIAALLNRTWGVVLDLPGFKVREDEVMPDGRRYIYWVNEKTKVLVSMTLEEVLPQLVTAGCRATLEVRAKRQGGVTKKDVKISERDPFVVLEFVIPEWDGHPVQQKNVLLCMFRDNVFVDAHISKVEYKPEDEKLFQDVAEHLQIREGIPRSSRDYWEAGSLHFFSKKFQLAIPSYAKALELEKQSPQLEKKFWYVLIDNLGMAYGFTGDLQSAKATFEYGLSIDSAYPLFYYNLASTYAEKGEKEQAIAHLKQAFERRENILPDEKMPDPAADDSFQKLMKDKQFRKFVNSLPKSSIPALPKSAASPGYLTFKLVPADASGSSISGTLNGKAGPISDAELVLLSVREEKCADTFNAAHPSKEALATLNACASAVAAARPDAKGHFEFKPTPPGYYSLRFLWNIAPQPQVAPTTYYDGQFLVMFTAQKDPSGRYDTSAQSRPFHFTQKESAIINFFDLKRDMYRILEGKP